MSAPLASFEPATTYDGLYFRDHLGADGTLPAQAPFGLSPDIIRTGKPVDDPSAVFGTPDSWAEFYPVEPEPGVPSYYYVRGRNDSAETVHTPVFLYAAPSQLILFPQTWESHQLRAGKQAFVEITAEPDAIGVAALPFTWKNPPALGGTRFYSFVAQANPGATDPHNGTNPIPTVTTWLGVGTLQRQDLGFGFRNSSIVSTGAAHWTRQLGLEIPASLDGPATVLIYVKSNGIVGDTVAFAADAYTPGKQPVSFPPTVVTGDGALYGVQVTLEPGFACTLGVQYWNTAAAPPSAGATITLAASYEVPDRLLAEAGRAGLLDPAHDRMVARAFGSIGPTALVTLGTATFQFED